MPRVGFESTIPAFVGAMTFHALDRATIVIDFNGTKSGNLCSGKNFHYYHYYLKYDITDVDFKLMHPKYVLL
jgi:hypothetical protein